jgi:hypothetical protein
VAIQPLEPISFFIVYVSSSLFLPHFLRNLDAMSEHTWQTWQGENEKREPKNLHFVIWSDLRGAA